MHGNDGWLFLLAQREVSNSFEHEVSMFRRRLSLGAGTSALVAVLDGAIDRTHPTFRETQWSTHASPEGTPTRHGTHVASIIARLAPDALLLPIPVFRDDRSETCSQRDLAGAIVRAVEAGAHIINISAGELAFAAAPDPLLENALRAADLAGAIVVAAAGNDGCACPHLPASWPTVLTVGAADENGAPLRTSNWGSLYRGHAVLAPGKNIRGAAPGGRWSTASGTSFAAAIISGVLAIAVAGEARRAHPRTPTEIARMLIQSSRPFGNDERALDGSLDLSAFADALDSGATTLAPASTFPRDWDRPAALIRASGQSTTPNVSLLGTLRIIVRDDDGDRAFALCSGILIRAIVQPRGAFAAELIDRFATIVADGMVVSVDGILIDEWVAVGGVRYPVIVPTPRSLRIVEPNAENDRLERIGNLVARTFAIAPHERAMQAAFLSLHDDASTLLTIREKDLENAHIHAHYAPLSVARRSLVQIEFAFASRREALTMPALHWKVVVDVTDVVPTRDDGPHQWWAYEPVALATTTA